MSPSKSSKKPSEQYSGWHFARDFFTGIFGLVNSGRVFPAFGLLLLAIMGLIVWRLPESDLGHVVERFFDFLGSSVFFVIILLVLTNVLWLILFRKQKRIYENEINRLSDIRKDLFHLGSNQVLISNHRSSTGSQVETYILPDTDASKKEVK
jgi:hypothetical protein